MESLKLEVVEASLIFLDSPSFPICFVYFLPKKRRRISLALQSPHWGRSAGFDRCVSSTQTTLSKCLLKGWRGLALRKYFLGLLGWGTTGADRQQKGMAHHFLPGGVIGGSLTFFTPVLSCQQGRDNLQGWLRRRDRDLWPCRREATPPSLGTLAGERRSGLNLRSDGLALLSLQRIPSWGLPRPCSTLTPCGSYSCWPFLGDTS